MAETIGLIGPTKSYGSGLIDLELVVVTKEYLSRTLRGPTPLILEVADKPQMAETIGLIGATKSYGSGLIDLEPPLSITTGVPFMLLQ